MACNELHAYRAMEMPRALALVKKCSVSGGRKICRYHDVFTTAVVVSMIEPREGAQRHRQDALPCLRKGAKDGRPGAVPVYVSAVAKHFTNLASPAKRCVEEMWPGVAYGDRLNASISRRDLIADTVLLSIASHVCRRQILRFIAG